MKTWLDENGLVVDMSKHMRRVWGDFMYGNGEEPNDGVFSILAYIADVCNYSCPYCYNEFPRSGNRLNLDKLFTLVTQVCEEKEIVSLDLIGGEPTLHPELVDFCRCVHDLYPQVKMAVYSNFSRSVSYYKDLISCGCELILSHHGECDSEEFIKKLMCFRPHERKLMTMMIMFEHDHIERCTHVFDELEKIGGFGELNIVSLNNTEQYKKTYSDKQLAELEKRALKTKTQHTTVVLDNNERISVDDNFFFLSKPNANFRWWMCNAGKDFIYIHHNGDIHPCDEHDGIILGNLYQEKPFIIPKKPMICKKDNCPCLFDVYKEKVFK